MTTSKNSGQADWQDGKIVAKSDAGLSEISQLALVNYQEFEYPYRSNNVLDLSKIFGAGMGIMAGITYSPGDIVEVGPGLSVPIRGKSALLDRYTFNNANNPNESVIGLGWTSLINHADDPNLIPIQDYKNKRVAFAALRRIQPGEELTFDYGPTYDKKGWTGMKMGHPGDRNVIWA